MVNYLNKRKGLPYSSELLEFTNSYKNISAIDVWGIGCIIVEIINGIPLWLNESVKIKVKGEEKIKCGLFATDSRAYIEILEKQLDLIRNFDRFVNE